jgi:hypothetical protein
MTRACMTEKQVFICSATAPAHRVEDPQQQVGPDPISPMLHQLRARADQRERSVLPVEPFHSRIIEMRELQLDDIAIPCFGVLDLFVVRQGREGGQESVGSMISLGVNAKQPQALVERVVR